MLTANEIRESFKQFFASKGHQIVPSAPMVIKDDPTLMFTNAGMNQFKDIILGNQTPKFKRATDSQKCLRVSGKHNDLEEVGHDTYHQTMFEMLGNWSFGDYFKQGAIDYAWEFLTDTVKLDPNRLYATIFEGSPAEGLSRDEEAAEIWSKHISKDRIINGNKHDNFWEMGDTGPCGPCSEIHIDLRPDEERKKIDGKSLVNKDHPQVIEIWNLVFMQYNRKADGTLEPLPKRVIDTGMGFERLCMALQGKTSNYDTDIFQPLIKGISQMAGIEYGKDKDKDVAMRVIADHVRTIAFSITDGQLPSNAKAGYVIRRILRRAVRYGYTFLGFKEAFMYNLVPILIKNMGEAYPELVSQKELIMNVTKEEEESFLRTLDNGIHLLNNVMDETNKAGKKQINGKDAFTLYDTFGFPLDLTELILRENGLTLNEDEFNAEMNKQKQRARNAAAVETGDWIESQPGISNFVGYDYTEYAVHILRYRKVTQKKKEFYEIVLDNTPFYAESGGQIGDTGILVREGETINVLDTKKENNLSIHVTTQCPKDPSAEFMACVDVDKRHASEANHSATHLLDQALRSVLGNHVEQKGSLVTPESLRFDFSHFQKVTDEELRKVERIINAHIREDIPLEEKRNYPIEEAKKLGAIALFGEKYGDKVRVVQFGQSIEFCGGTHVSATGKIGMFKIISESSIAAGVRRIEAVTGAKAEEMMEKYEDSIKYMKELFNNVPDLTGAVKKSIDENAELKKQIDEFMKEKISALKDSLAKGVEEINGIKIIKLVAPMPSQIAKDLAFQLSADIPDNFIFAAGTEESNRPTLTLSITKDLVAKGLNAGKIIKEAAKLIQGGGGGQPHFATAGGKDAEKLHQAVDKIIELSTI